MATPQAHNSPILTPDSPYFTETLNALIPQFWGQKLEHCGGHVVWAVRAGSGLMEPLSHAEADEYLYGGEYDQVGREQGEDEAIWVGE